MAKKMPSLAIAVFSLAMLSSNSNAGWLDIVKGIAGGIFGVPVQQNLQQQPAQSAQPPPSNATAAKASSPPVQPTEEEVLAAIDSLTAVCGKISSQGLPCGIGTGRGKTVSTAQEIASDRAIKDLAKSIQTSVEVNGNDIRNAVDDGENVIDEQVYSSATKFTVNTQVKGSQTYMSYTYKKDNIIQTTIVKVLNPALFEKALNATAKGEPLGRQLLQESIKGATESIRDWYKKNKR